MNKYQPSLNAIVHYPDNCEKNFAELAMKLNNEHSISAINNRLSRCIKARKDEAAYYQSKKIKNSNERKKAADHETVIRKLKKLQDDANEFYKNNGKSSLPGFTIDRSHHIIIVNRIESTKSKSIQMKQPQNISYKQPQNIFDVLEELEDNTGSDIPPVPELPKQKSNSQSLKSSNHSNRSNKSNKSNRSNRSNHLKPIRHNSKKKPLQRPLRNINNKSKKNNRGSIKS